MKRVEEWCGDLSKSMERNVYIERTRDDTRTVEEGFVTAFTVERIGYGIEYTRASVD